MMDTPVGGGGGGNASTDPEGRRPILGMGAAPLHDQEVEVNKECCNIFKCCACNCCEGMCDCCAPVERFPPIRESAFNRVYDNFLMWNRPIMVNLVEWKWMGCARKPPKKKACCRYYIDNDIRDRITVVHHDQYKEAVVEKNCQYPCCCLSCCITPHVLLVDKENRWSCCKQGHHLFFVGDPQAFVDAANAAKDAAKAKAGGSLEPEGKYLKEYPTRKDREWMKEFPYPFRAPKDPSSGLPMAKMVRPVPFGMM